MSGSECTRKLLFDLKPEARCEYAKDNCQDEVNVFNLTTFYFCQLDEMWYLMIPLMIFIVLFCFRLIGDISDDYLSIALGNVSKRLGMTEALTGVTLLAYANGAPDIISSMVAGDQADGALLSIGALYGASLFTCNFVFGSVVHNAVGEGNLELPRSLFIRDIMFFFGATTLLIILAFTGIDTIWVAVILLSSYVVYVLIVAFEEYTTKKADGDRGTPLSQVSSSLDENTLETESKEEKPQLVHQDTIVTHERHMKGRGLAKFFKSQRHRIGSKCSEGSIMDKIFFIFELPAFWILQATIPPGDKEEYHYCYGLMYPITMVLAFLISTQQTIFVTINIFSTEVQILYLTLPFQILLFVLIALYTSDENPRLPLLMMALSSVMSVVWVYLVANIVMDILNWIQVISGFPKIFLGLTLLSLGNSLGDFFVDTALAKKGYTTMAFTGIFSGQLLNLLIGFAMNCFSSYFSAKKANKDTSFKIFDNNVLSDSGQFLCFFVMAYSSVRLLSYIVIGCLSNYSLNRYHKYVGLGVYITFILLFILFQFAIFRD